MSDLKPQSFKSHASFDPWYHYVALAALLFLFVLSIVLFVQNFGKDILTHLFLVVLSFTLIVLAFKLRAYPLKVQDRVIRMEERFRLAMLLPDALKKRIPELTEDQLIGLRFASDNEVPSLVELTLEKNLNRKEIKERIQVWRPDHWRI